MLREILEQAAPPEPKRGALDALIGDAWAACMDEATAEKLGSQPLKPELEAIAACSRRRPARAAGAAAARGRPAVLQLRRGPGLQGRHHEHGGRRPGRSGPARPRPVPEGRRALGGAAQKSQKHVASTFALLGETPDQAAASAAAVMEVETGLARVSMERVKRRDPQNRYNKRTREELQKLVPSFAFARFFEAAGAPPFDGVNVSSLPFFEGLEAQLQGHDLGRLKTYLRWQVARAAAPLLSKAFVDESFDFYGRTLTGAKEQRPRWKRCADVVDGDLGEALGQRYVERTFGADGKARMNALVAGVEKALGSDIRTLPWMTDATRQKALEKLSAISNNVGYPDTWRDYSPVVIKRDDLVGNSRRANEFEWARDVKKIGQKADRKEWGMSPPTVNAYYSPLNNSINFPAGILQPPFFDRQADEALNYGGIGAVIGHELTHGFDDSGRKFAGDGNLTDWWTEADGAEFEKRAQCVADQYSGYTAVEEVKLNGKLTLGENMADNGGVRVAYGASRHAGRAPGRAAGRLHAAAALLPGLRPDLVPEHHAGSGPAARPDRPALARPVARQRRGREHAGVRAGLQLQAGPADGAGERLPGLVAATPRRETFPAGPPARQPCPSMAEWPVLSRATGVAAVLALAYGAAACREASAPLRPRPSVLLVTIDTLRADRLGCYGRAGAETPAIDGLARAGLLFRRAYTSVPLTLPAHATLLTGLEPAAHGLVDNGMSARDLGAPTLAERLSGAGYDTAAFVAAHVLNRIFGLDRGFGLYDDGPPDMDERRDLPRGQRRPRPGRRRARVAAASAPEAVLPVVAPLRRARPARAPAPFAQRFAADPYDGEVAYVDSQVARLLRGLANLGLERDTLVVLAADHGEGLGEHGEETHGILLHDATLRVPLILRLPDRLAPGEVGGRDVALADVAPTVLELCGLPPNPRSHGTSLLRDGPDGPARALWAASDYPARQFGWAPLRSLRVAGFKFVEAPRPELYDLAQDAGETRDLAARDPRRVAEMRARLLQVERTLAEARPALAPVEPDGETRERLGALGYVADPGLRAKALDPKDGVARLALVGKAYDALESGALEAARASFGRPWCSSRGAPRRRRPGPGERSVRRLRRGRRAPAEGP